MSYDTLVRQTLALGQEEPWSVALFSNVSALIMDALPDLNWAGFYYVRGDRLTLGPFQGKVACIHIDHGHGVCGTAWRLDEVQRVDDVHQFPGHIACDAASNAEIVLPIHVNGKVFAVLDIDSPVPNRFTEEDQTGLTALVRAIEGIVQP